MEAIIGSVVGSDYKILCLLGGGSYGQTYLAENKSQPTSSKYVIKQFKPVTDPINPINRSDAISRFRKEAEILSMLGQNERIPSLIDFIEENNQFYIVQEFIDGEDLESILREKQILRERFVLSLLKNLLETLDYVHQQNIIHRDIKPSNIILRWSDGKPVLIDFGAIKNIEIATSRSRARTMAIGTQDYMSNEQANGNPRLCSDIYSLGIVALRSLLGYLPEEDYDTGELEWDSLNLVNLSFSNFIRKMTRSHFRDRYLSAKEALKVISQIEIIDNRNPIHIDLNFLKKPDEIWIERAKSTRAKGFYGETISLYKMAISSNIRCFKAWFNLGISCSYLKDYEKSLFYYSEALKLRPNAYNVWFHKGVSLFRLERYDDSINCFQKSINCQPFYALNFLYKALYFYLTGNLDDSKIMLAQSLRCRPGIDKGLPRILNKAERTHLKRLKFELVEHA